MARISAFLCGQLGRFATLAPDDVPDAVTPAVRAAMATIAAKHGLSEPQQVEPERLAIVARLLAGRTLAVEEFETLVAGGTPRPDAATIARAFPGVAHRFYQ